MQPVVAREDFGQGDGARVAYGVGAEEQVTGVRGGGGDRQQAGRSGRAEPLLAEVDAAVGAQGAEREGLVGVDGPVLGEPGEQRGEAGRVGRRQVGVLDRGAPYGCRLCHHHSTGFIRRCPAAITT